MMVRAAVFHELGGCDGWLVAHMEEIDFCWRARLRGWRIAVQPASAVYHLGGGMLPNDSPRKIYLNYRNNLAMLYKNLPAGRLQAVLLTRMLLDGVSAMLFLLQGKRDFFSAVWRAHRDFRTHRSQLREQRREIQQSTLQPANQVYAGSIVLRYYLLRKQIFGRLL